MKRKKAVTLTTAALALTMAVCGSSTAIAASETFQKQARFFKYLKNFY